MYSLLLFELDRLPVLHSSRYTPRLIVYPEIKSYAFSNGKALQNNRSIDHQRVWRYAPFHSLETCAKMDLRDSLLMFVAYKIMLGRTETRTRDRIYCHTIRTVRYISRDDRARIATCSLQTPTDRIQT